MYHAGPPRTQMRPPRPAAHAPAARLASRSGGGAALCAPAEPTRLQGNLEVSALQAGCAHEQRAKRVATPTSVAERAVAAGWPAAAARVVNRAQALPAACPRAAACAALRRAGRRRRCCTAVVHAASCEQRQQQRRARESASASVSANGCARGGRRFGIRAQRPASRTGSTDGGAHGMTRAAARAAGRVPPATSSQATTDDSRAQGDLTASPRPRLVE